MEQKERTFSSQDFQGLAHDITVAPSLEDLGITKSQSSRHALPAGGLLAGNSFW